MGLSTGQQLFVQAMANRGPLAKDSTMTMFRSVEDSNSDEEFLGFLGAVNKELEFLQLEVKKVINQYDGKEFYGLINTLPSKEAKLGTTYSAAQITFFRAVVEAIVQDPTASGVLSSTAALNLRLETQDSNSQDAPMVPMRLSMQARQDTLELMAANLLLGRDQDGGVTLGVKAFLELRSMFRTLEVPFCTVCNEAAIKAQLCANEACTTRLHSYCVERKFHSRNQRSECSECGAEWRQLASDPDAGYEEANPGAQNTPNGHLTPDPNSSRRPRSRRKVPTRRRNVVEDDEDEEEENGNESDSDDPPRRSRRQNGLVHEEMENGGASSQKGSQPFSQGTRKMRGQSNSESQTVSIARMGLRSASRMNDGRRS